MNDERSSRPPVFDNSKSQSRAGPLRKRFPRTKPTTVSPNEANPRIPRTKPTTGFPERSQPRFPRTKPTPVSPNEANVKLGNPRTKPTSASPNEANDRIRDGGAIVFHALENRSNGPPTDLSQVFSFHQVRQWPRFVKCHREPEPEASSPGKPSRRFGSGRLFDLACFFADESRIAVRWNRGICAALLPIVMTGERGSSVGPTVTSRFCYDS